VISGEKSSSRPSLRKDCLGESSVGRNRFVGVVKLLLQNGAESSVEDEAALYEGAKKGHPDVRIKAARRLSSSVTEGRVSKRARY
jgi:hypothetical protein